MSSTQAEAFDHRIYSILSDISKHAIIGSPQHIMFCFLLKPLVSGPNISKMVSKSVRDIYLDIVKKKYDLNGIGLMWFLLDMCDVSKHHTDKLKQYIQQEFWIDDPEDIKEFHFRKLLATLSTELASNHEGTSEFIRYVTELHLERETAESFEGPSDFVSLIKLFEAAEQQEKVGPEPPQLEELKKWLRDVKRSDLKKVVAKFNPNELISITPASKPIVRQVSEDVPPSFLNTPPQGQGPFKFLVSQEGDPHAADVTAGIQAKIKSLDIDSSLESTSTKSDRLKERLGESMEEETKDPSSKTELVK